MFSLPPEDRAVASGLFAEVELGRAFVESALLDGYGQVVVDDAAAPTVAVLFYGGLVIYGGDYGCPAAGEILRHFEVQPLIVGYSDGWNRVLEQVHGERLKLSQRYHLPSSGLDRRALNTAFAETGRHCRPAEIEDSRKLQADLGWDHHLHHYKDPSDFVTRGNCFVVGRDGKIVSAASSFVVSGGYSECQVTTDTAARRKGFARDCAARYLLQCATAGIDMPWDAANQESVALARALGFTNVVEYPVYEYGLNDGND